MNKIGRLNIQNEILEYSEVENHFKDHQNVIKVSNNENKVDFSIIRNLIEKAEAKPNIYGILIKKPNDENWELKYIGQRKSKYIKDRLRQHLIKKHAKTGAQLKRVKEVLEDGNE